ncbi:MAG: hypothetical protein EZS28_024080, partial [Streblomastix strix]
MVVYMTQAKHFAQQVNNLKSVSDLATYCCQMSPLGLMLLVHDYEFNFQYPGSADGKAATIRRLSGVKTKLKETSADIIKVISQLYDMTSLTDPWEENSMEAYIFETGDGICTRIDGVEGQCEGFITRHQEATNNLISGFIEMAQKAHYMGNAEGDLHQFSTFHSDLAYIIFNPISPILESCKRAMVKYWEFTTSLTSQILMIFLSVILSIMILEFTLLAIIYIMFSLKIIKERKNALQQALEVSKQKMQKVIRRLLQEDDDEDGNEDQTQDGSFVQHDQSAIDFSEYGKQQQLKEQEQEQDLNDLDLNQKQKDKQIQQYDESSDVSEEDEAEDEKILFQNNENENNYLIENILKQTQSNNQYNQPSSPSNPRILDPKIQSISMGPAVKFDLKSIQQSSQNLGQQNQSQTTTGNSGIFRSNNINSPTPIATNSGNIGMSQRSNQPGFQQQSPQIVSVNENITPQMLNGDFNKVPTTGQQQMIPWQQQPMMQSSSPKNSTVEIIIAGMRPPTYAQMQYFALRLIFNYSQINLKEPVQFKYSSSPVWNDSSHIQNNKTRLMQLLKGMSLQLRKIHDNFNYGSSEYTITGDQQIDTMKTTRWKTKDNVKFLFEETDCHLKDENLCKDQPEGGQGTGTQRIF